jgi:hypothetical protein
MVGRRDGPDRSDRLRCFQEPMTTLKIVSTVLIVAGVLGLNAGGHAG